jgi:hypothetical protein
METGVDEGDGHSRVADSPAVGLLDSNSIPFHSVELKYPRSFRFSCGKTTLNTVAILLAPLGEVGD